MVNILIISPKQRHVTDFIHFENSHSIYSLIELFTQLGKFPWDLPIVFLRLDRFMDVIWYFGSNKISFTVGWAHLVNCLMYVF